MAEEEKIREHVKHALQDLTDKTKSWKDRIKDFAWEVFIIIVAVNITLWFHSWNEKRHDRELEKNFLIGIRSDLDKVKNSFDFHINTSQPMIDYYDSVLVQIKEHRIDKAFVDSNSFYLMTTNYFIYDNSRFESFKSSGNLRLIENDSLLQSLTSLYSALLPAAVQNDNLIFDERRRDFIKYIGSKAQFDNSGNMEIYVSELLSNPEVKFQLFWQKTMLISRQNQLKQFQQQVEKIINAIDRELKTRFNYQEK